MFYVYAISSLERNYIYVGMTTDVNSRVKRHNNGYERTTKPYSPFELIFTEAVDGDRVEVRKREKYWKSGIGKERLREIRDKK